MALRRWTVGVRWISLACLLASGGCGSSSSSLPAPDAAVADAAGPVDGPSTPVRDAAPGPSPDAAVPADGAATDSATPSDGAAGDAMASADTGDAAARVVSSLKIAPMDPHMRAGELLPLIATATFTDSTSAQVTSTATWTSSDPKVATVDVMGQVSGLTGGTALIKAVYQGAAASVTVTVRMVTPSALMLSPGQLSLDVGDTATLGAVLVFSDGSSKDVTPDATWTSSNAAVAEVDRLGVVTAKGPGSADITVTHLGLSAKAAVTASNAALVALIIAPTTLTIPAGQSRFFSLTAERADGTQRNVAARAAWSSSNPAVATVGTGVDSGQITGVGPGTTTITATYQTLMVTALVTVP